MARLQAIALLLTAALAVASGARMPLQVAPAPAPSSTGPIADVLFLIEAAQATFTDATTLTLSGVTGTAQSFAAPGRTAIYPIEGFTNATAGAQFVDASGQWLGNPTALIRGVANSNATAMLVSLSKPTVSAASSTVTNNNAAPGATITNNNGVSGQQTLSFTVKVLPAEAASVKYAGGAVAAAVTDAANGAGAFVTTTTPGATLSSVALFIDQNQQGLAKPAAAEWGWGGWFDQGSNNWGGWNGGWSNGWNSNNGWNNNQGNNGWNNNQGSSYTNNNNVVNGGWGGQTSINNNNVPYGGNGQTAINNNNVGSGVAINNNNVG